MRRTANSEIPWLSRMSTFLVKCHPMFTDGENKQLRGSLSIDNIKHSSEHVENQSRIFLQLVPYLARMPKSIRILSHCFHVIMIRYKCFQKLNRISRRSTSNFLEKLNVFRYISVLRNFNTLSNLFETVRSLRETFSKSSRLILKFFKNSVYLKIISELVETISD